MSSETSTSRTFRFLLLTIASLAFFVALASGIRSIARAQSDDGASDVAVAQSGADQQGQSDEAEAAKAEAQANAAQKAHDAADAAAEALQTARDKRNDLESSDAPQDQIDAANQDIAQKRAEKDAAERAAEKADEAMSK